MATKVEIEVSGSDQLGKSINQFKELKSELKDNIGILAGLTEGTDEFARQAAKVGQLKDRIGDLNQSVAAVSGAPIENLTGSFGLLSGQVRNLDFGGASNSLSQFSGVIKNTKFSDLTDGLKGFVSGLGTLGKALLTNPIFLITSVIVAVGAAMFALKDKVKVVGQVFDGLGQVIDDIKQSLKDFTDQIGLTNFASEDQANKAIENAKKTQSALELRYDREITLLKAAGKETTEQEILKQKAVQQSILVQIDSLKKLSDANDVSQEDFEKTLVKLNDLKKQYIDAGVQIAATEIAENKKANDKKEADNKKFNDARLADNKRLQKQIEDEQIAAIKDEKERATAAAVLAKQRRDEDIENSKASAEIKREALVASETQLATDILAINKQFDDKRKAEADKQKELANKDLIAGAELKVAQDQKDIEAQIALLETKKQIELENANLTANEKLLIEQNYTNQVSQLRADAAAKEKELANKDLIAGAELKVAQDQKDIEAQIALLETKKQIELENANLTANEKLLIEQNYTNQVSQLRADAAAKEKELDQERVNATLEIAQTSNSSLQSLSDALFAVKAANTKKGTAEEEKAARAQFKINKGLAIANAVISGIQGVINALSAQSVIPEPFGTILKVASAVGIGIAAAANVAKIASTQYGGSGGGAAATTSVGGGASSAAAALPDSSAKAFDPNTIGKAGSSSSGTEGERTAGGAPVQKVVVLESDITKTQKKVGVAEASSTF